jgi:lauroyl/myristoyl acyltransferase
MIFEVEKNLQQKIPNQSLSKISQGVITIKLLSDILQKTPVGYQEADCINQECPQGLYLFEKRIKLTRILEEMLPIPILKIALFPIILIQAFPEWFKHRNWDWRSKKLPHNFRFHGNQKYFIWKKCMSFFYGQTLVCFPEKLCKSRWKKRFNVKNIEKLESEIEKKQPIILASLHFGHFRLMRYALYAHGINIGWVISANPKNKRKEKALITDKYINERFPNNQIHPTFALKEIAELTRFTMDGNPLLAAIDVINGMQIRSEFEYGTFQMTTGIISMAKIMSAKIIPCLLYEDSLWNYKLHIGDPIDPRIDGKELSDQQISDEIIRQILPIVSNYSSQIEFFRLDAWQGNGI